MVKKLNIFELGERWLKLIIPFALKIRGVVGTRADFFRAVECRIAKSYRDLRKLGGRASVINFCKRHASLERSAADLCNAVGKSDRREARASRERRELYFLDFTAHGDFGKGLLAVGGEAGEFGVEHDLDERGIIAGLRRGPGYRLPCRKTFL